MIALITHYINRAIAFTRQFPKIILVTVVFLGSTLWFVSWWNSRNARKPEAVQARLAAQAAAEKAVEDKMSNRLARVFLAGDDLYDAENGELVFPKWLDGEHPTAIYYQTERNRILCRFDRSFSSYTLEGAKERTLTQRYGIYVLGDLTGAVYPKDGDLWRAEVDWQDVGLKNERQITHLGNLKESFMLDNISLASDKFLVLRNLNQMLRIDMTTGDVVPVKLPINPRGRSPDGEMQLGDAPERGASKLYSYDLDSDKAKIETVPHPKIRDYAWIDEQRCLILAGTILKGGDTILLYERGTNAFSTLCRVPQGVQRLAALSPDKRYIFGFGGPGVVLIDIEGKSTSPQNIPGQNFEWISADTLIVTAEVPSTEHRGTWILKIGSEPRRVSQDPYMVSRDGGTAVLVFPEPRWVVFGTRDRLFRMNTDGDELKELTTLRRPVTRLQKMSEWPVK